MHVSIAEEGFAKGDGRRSDAGASLVVAWRDFERRLPGKMILVSALHTIPRKCNYPSSLLALSRQSVMILLD